MRPFVIEERARLKQKQKNLQRACDVVKQFPMNRSIRIPVYSDLEIELPVDNLTTQEKIILIYETLNEYIYE
jgi:hypothetical protein